MAKSKKVYRRFIRVNGTLESSPRFDNRADADAWIESRQKEKNRRKAGLGPDISPIIFIDYARKWMKDRKNNYHKSTWGSDEQRLRDYILPEFAGRLMHTISSKEIIGFLKVTKKESNLSMNTINKIKVLMSTIYSSALEDGHTENNPVIGVKLTEKRKGRKAPKTYESTDQVLAYLGAAKRVAALKEKVYPIAEVFAYLSFFTGMRKQELVAVKWGDFYPEENMIIVRWKYLQADHEIIKGTKKGEDTERAIIFDEALTRILLEYREKSQHKSPDNFILSQQSGDHFSPYQLSRLHKEIQIEAGFTETITVHQIRHTFGRHYVKAKGNQKALQSLLGHSSSTTTDIYSELNQAHLKNMDHSGVYKDEKS